MASDSIQRLSSDQHNTGTDAKVAKSSRKERINTRAFESIAVVTVLAALTAGEMWHRLSSINNTRQETEGEFNSALYDLNESLLRDAQAETQTALQRAVAAELDLKKLMEAIEAQGGDPEAMLNREE